MLNEDTARKYEAFLAAAKDADVFLPDDLEFINALKISMVNARNILFCFEDPGPLGQFRVLGLCLKNRCKSLK